MREGRWKGRDRVEAIDAKMIKEVGTSVRGRSTTNDPTKKKKTTKE